MLPVRAVRALSSASKVGPLKNFATLFTKFTPGGVLTVAVMVRGGVTMMPLEVAAAKVAPVPVGVPAKVTWPGVDPAVTL